MDAERAHELGLWAISSGFVSSAPTIDERLATPAFGTTLANPLGLAAGFDKNAVALDNWHRLGFAFVEVGTVTLEPQSGNPKPRLFRLPQENALINRLGFNSAGADEVAKNIESSSPRIPFGINIGKNKATPLEHAHRNYASAFDKLWPHGHYAVVNVSSPNTPELRNLQQIPFLEKIVRAVLRSDKPLFVKVSPDEDDKALCEIVKFSVDSGVTGIVATNTTLQHSHPEMGGLSGMPLRERAEDVCKRIRDLAGASLQIVAVGGIFTGEDLYRRLAAGANCCQIYTSFVYRGPRAPGLILGELISIMEERSCPTVAELVRTGG